MSGEKSSREAGFNIESPLWSGGVKKAMNKPDEFSAEELEASRRTAKAALQAAAEHVSGASQDGSVASYFNWEIPELITPHLITFLARVRCHADERSLRFQIDVGSLAAHGRTGDLEKLHAILSARHAGLDDRHSLMQAIEWMVNVSLEQVAPELSPAERQVKVRQLLLANKEPSL
jgi:hypothetical protein